MYLIDTLGFEAHMRNMRAARGEKVPEVWYKRPYCYELYLTKNKTKKHGDIIEVPRNVLEPDYEFEIAAKFTEDFQTANVQKAIEFVKTKMQFAIMNDFSSRDFQRSDMLLPLSVSPSKGILPKSFGKWFGPNDSGHILEFDQNGIPYIATKLWTNGMLRAMNFFQSIYFTNPGSEELKCWGFAQTIAWFGSLNRGFKKGWILGSGTIGFGSIAECRPQYEWLKNGDVIQFETDVLGILENKIKIVDITKD